MLLVRWMCCCCMWRTPSQNFWKIQQQSWERKARLKLWYFKVLWPYIYYILLVNYEVLLHSVKEKMNSIEPSGTGIMLQLDERFAYLQLTLRTVVINYRQLACYRISTNVISSVLFFLYESENFTLCVGWRRRQNGVWHLFGSMVWCRQYPGFHPTYLH